MPEIRRQTIKLLKLFGMTILILIALTALAVLVAVLFIPGAMM